MLKPLPKALVQFSSKIPLIPEEEVAAIERQLNHLHHSPVAPISPWKIGMTQLCVATRIKL